MAISNSFWYAQVGMVVFVFVSIVTLIIVFHAIPETHSMVNTLSTKEETVDSGVEYSIDGIDSSDIRQAVLSGNAQKLSEIATTHDLYGLLDAKSKDCSTKDSHAIKIPRLKSNWEDLLKETQDASLTRKSTVPKFKEFGNTWEEVAGFISKEDPVDFFTERMKISHSEKNRTVFGDLHWKKIMFEIFQSVYQLTMYHKWTTLVPTPSNLGTNFNEMVSTVGPDARYPAYPSLWSSMAGAYSFISKANGIDNDEMCKIIAESRFWGGHTYIQSTEEGLKLGESIAQHVIDKEVNNASLSKTFDIVRLDGSPITINKIKDF
jgi:hypothetical protein